MNNNFAKECVKNSDVIFMFRAIYGQVNRIKDFTKYSLKTRQFVVKALLQTPKGTKILQEFPMLVFDNNDWKTTKKIEQEYICWLCWGLSLSQNADDSLHDMEFQFETLKEFHDYMNKNNLVLPPSVANLFLEKLGVMNEFVGDDPSPEREQIREYIRKFTK